MMKKFIVFLCVAGVLTGCAVGGEKTTAPKQEAKTRRSTGKRDREDGRTEGDCRDGRESDEDAMPENFRELFSMEAD